MVKIYYSSEPDIQGINKELTPPLNDEVLYDVARDNFPVLVRDIIFNKEDADKTVIVITYFDEVTYYKKTTNNLKLNTVKRIILQKSKDTDLSDESLNSALLDIFESSSDFLTTDSNSNSNDDSSSNGNSADTPPPPQTKPEPNNDDKSKDETSLWMFLTNNLWLLIIICIVIIISVYVYMTFQDRTEAYKTSILGDSTFNN